MNIKPKLAALPLALFLAFSAQAQQAPSRADEAAAARANAEQNQQIQQQREAQQREATVQAPSVRSELPKQAGFPVLPVEATCFPIDAFKLDVPTMVSDAARSHDPSLNTRGAFSFANEWLAHYHGQCIGKEGIAALVKGLQQEMLARGYVTTRVLVPQQDLSNGSLAFTIVPGTIHELRFADASLRGTWRTAFPARAGDLLNLRDLEQGLDQIKRPTSQDATMQIVPAQTPGESDVVISVNRAKPWTMVASVDDSGQRATGKLQGNVTLGIDNIAGLNDLFNVGVNHDLEFNSQKLGSRGFNGSYSVPLGYWTATLSGNSNNYHQQIAGANQTFVSSGNAKNTSLRLQRVLSRGQSDVIGGYVQLSKRFGASFIDDTEIDLQHRNNTLVELGLTDRHYIGAAQMDGSLGYRQGIGWLGAAPDPSLPPNPNIAPTPATKPAGPTYRFRMAVLDLNVSVPFQLGEQSLRYVATVHGQYTNNSLYYIDDLSIGSRYTVRGFDGEQMLAAERGLYWRNELQMPISPAGPSLYAGIDYGHVYGPNAAFLTGTQLAGAVAGMRGALPLKHAGISYEFFIGTPIYKPAGFEASRITGGFQLMAQF
jgi:hemolysin activation/secretion protein